MTRILLRWVPAAVGSTLLMAGVLLFAPFETELTLRVYLLVLGALALATVVSATAEAAGTRPSEFERALAPAPARPARPDELERLERQVALGVESAIDFHSRLRPALVDAAAAALWRAHAVSLEAQPERARELLPEDVWAIVRPDRARPVDRDEPGPSLDELDRVVTAIERMSA